MATRAETRRIRLAQWNKIFSDRAGSGLSVKDYCAQNNISRDSYFYWQNIARKDALSHSKLPALVELKPPAETDAHNASSINGMTDHDPHITVTVGNATITVDSGTPKELLSMVMEVVMHAE